MESEIRKVTAALGALLTALAVTPVAIRAAEPVATFSIVGYDAATGELGIAVQSKFFAVGSVVPWAKAGVGAIATQASANTTFGPKGLELLAAGNDPEETLKRLLAADDGRDRRQVGLVDARGRSVSYTGTECQPWAGGESGASFAAQGNILTGEEVVAGMARAYRETEGMLGEKLMRALEAGQAAGGDSRGMQSAAILIVKEKSGYGGFDDRYCDLRVDDHVAPIAELRRIFDMWKIQALVLEGYRKVEAGEFDAAIRIGEEAIGVDDGGESHYHLACYLSRAGKGPEALRRLAEAVKRDRALGPRAATDPDFEPLRGEAEFQRLTATEPR